MESIRFADYFFRAGLGTQSSLAKSRIAALDLSSLDLTTENTPEDPNRKEPHPLTYKYEASTIFRYPEKDYSETEVYPPFTPMFCFPSDISFVNHESGKPPDTFHSFVITESNGAKAYGVCLTTYIPPRKEHSRQIDAMITEWRHKNLADSDYEFAQHVQAQLAFEKEKLLKMKMGISESDPESTHVAQETINVLEELMTPLRQSVLVEADRILVPTCVGVMGRWPWYDLLKDWLCLVVRSVQAAEFERFPFERCVINLIHEIPLPPPGKLEIGIAFGEHKLFCSRPPINTCQTLKNFSCYPVFRALSIENILTLFELLTTEYKVVLVSEHTSMLNLVCETLCAWLYPFYWHHILIPVLPSRLIGYLQAPVPFLVGIQKASFPQWDQDSWRPGDAAVVDIDNDIIDFPPLKVKIPTKERKKLAIHLEKYSGQSHHSILKGVPETMKNAFPAGKLQLSSVESLIERRRIQDIPQSMYTMYSNSFLVEKGNGGKNHHAKIPTIHHGVSQSFENVSAHGSQGMRPQIHTRNRSSISSAIGSPPTAESYVSFVQTPRHSSSQPPLASETPVDDAMHLSIHNSIINPTVNTDRPVQSPSSTLSASPTKSPSKIPWWQKLSVATPGVAANSEEKLESKDALGYTGSKPRSIPTFYERMIGIHDSSVSIASAAPTAASSSILGLGGESPQSTTNSHIDEHSPHSPNLTHFKEGHMFHELCLIEPSREVGIDEENSKNSAEDYEPEEFADRFTPDSNSSDEMSKSDMSTANDNRPPLFQRRSQRVAGQSRNSSKDIFQRRKPSEISPTMMKAQQVKLKEKNHCKMCREEYDPYKEVILMCQYCHIQIHASCLIMTEANPCAVHFNEERISQGFFKVFTSLLRNYRSHLRVPVKGAVSEDEDGSSMAQWFHKPEFIGEFELDSKPFMTVLVETQAYAQFILDRIESPEDDYEVLFFDESIKQKMNRSRMRFTKQQTPFLNETTYQISNSITALSYNTENLPKDEFTLDPLDWQKAFVIEPRPIQQLITEGDRQMMKSHTNELVQRSRIATLRGKQDFSKWMKQRWRGLNQGGTDAFSTDENRRERLEERLGSVSEVIDLYECAHVSSQTPAQVEIAIKNLIKQNIKLQQISDEEQLMDGTDTDQFQLMLIRLMRVISIYQEHQTKFHSAAALGIFVADRPPPLPPRKSTTSPIRTTSNPTKVATWMSSIPMGLHEIDNHSLGTGRNSASSYLSSVIGDDIRTTINQRNISFVAIPDGEGGGMKVYPVDAAAMARFAALQSSTDLYVQPNVSESEKKVGSPLATLDKPATPGSSPNRGGFKGTGL